MSCILIATTQNKYLYKQLYETFTFDINIQKQIWMIQPFPVFNQHSKIHKLSISAYKCINFSNNSKRKILTILSPNYISSGVNTRPITCTNTDSIWPNNKKKPHTTNITTLKFYVQNTQKNNYYINTQTQTSPDQ